MKVCELLVESDLVQLEASPFNIRKLSQAAVSDVAKRRMGMTDYAFIQDFPELKAEYEKIQSAKSKGELTSEMVEKYFSMLQKYKEQDAKDRKKSGEDERPSVKERIPELQALAKDIHVAMKNGTITQKQIRDYQRLVNKYKPVVPYTSKTIPDPADFWEMYHALTVDKREKVDVDIKDGTRVRLRLDIPAYNKFNVWVPTIYIGSETVSHRSYAVVEDVSIGDISSKSLKIAVGGQKNPFAVIDGTWVNMSKDQAVSEAKAALDISNRKGGDPRDREWVQVGMDPERHGYFYDKHTMLPIVGGSKAIQVGAVIVIKDPKFGSRKGIF